MLEDIKILMLVRQQPEKLTTLSEPTQSVTAARLAAARLHHHSVSVRFADTLAQQEPDSLLAATRSHLRSGYYYIEGYNRRKPAPIPATAQAQLAPAAKHCEISRCSTKFRVISSFVPVYINPDKHWINSKNASDYPTLRIVTTCGINLMGTSYKEQGHYLQNDRLNHEAYQRDLEKIIENLFMHAIEESITTIRTAPFGVGAYLKKVTAPEDKEFARAKTVELFARYAKRHSIKVIWTIWARDEEAKIKKELDEATLNRNQLNHAYIEIKIGDILSDAVAYSQECQTNRQANTEFLLNAGSDRTIGGKWTAEDPHTIEEQLAQFTGLLDVQTVTHNPGIEAKLQRALRYLTSRTVALRIASPAATTGLFGSSITTLEDAAKETTRRIATAIQIKHALEEIPTVEKERHSNVLRVSFQQPAVAKKFFTTLKDLGFFKECPDKLTTDITTIQLKDPDEVRRYFASLNFM